MPNYRHAYVKPKRSKAPIVAIVAIAVIAAVVAALAFAFSGQGGSADKRTESAGEPMSGTTFTEAIAEEEAPAADDVIMTLPGSRDTYMLAGETYIESGCRAVDPDAGDITSTIEASGEVDATTPGTYQVTYTATTADGAKAQATRNVHVVESFDAAAKDVPVLMYHYVYDEAAPPEEINGNYITTTKLAAQCEYLQQNDFYYPSFQELRAWIDGTHSLPAKSVVLTFDDGEYNFLDYGIPVLEQYEVPATSFVIGSNNGAEKVITYASPYVQFESHSYDMHRAGGGNVGQGGLIHALTQQQIYDDIIASNQVTGGNGAVAMAYPFGDNNEAAWAALDDAGVLCAFTVKNARIHPGDNPMALNRVRISGEYSLDSFIGLVNPTV